MRVIHDQSLALLFEYFDKPLPIENKAESVHTVGKTTIWLSTFECFDLAVEIQIAKILDTDHQVIDWILEGVRWTKPDDPEGYTITFRANGKADIEDSNKEYLVGDYIAKQIDEYVADKSWNYLILTGDPGSKNKLYQMISQRLSRTQPDVERVMNRSNDFVVSRF